MRRERTRRRRACALALAALCAGAPAPAFSSHAVGDPAARERDTLGEEEAGDPPGVPARTREVAPGDTLWSIAAAALGDGTLWAAVYRANRDRIKDPARIYPGQRLAVPDVAPGAMAAVRREGAALAAD